MSNQSKVVSMAMIILFLAFIVVYVLFYQIHGKVLSSLFVSTHSETTENEPIPNPSLTILSGEKSDADQLAQKMGVEELLWALYSNTAGWDAIQDSEPIGSASTEIVPGTIQQHIEILSGTEMFFGVVEAVDLLDLQPQYLLKDYKDIYYARLDKYPIGLKSLVQLLGWNLYQMTTEKEIIENVLFGDKITYVNLPEYKNILVIMIIELKGEVWLLQIPYPKYHHSKEYLKTLFI